MRLKWLPLIFLAFLLGSCATLTYDKPSWGTSSDPYAILVDLHSANSGWTFDFYEIPSQNKIQLRFPNRRILEIYDRGGSLDDLRLAVAKYSEWKDQLKDTGGKVSKPINEISVFYPGQEKEVLPSSYYSLAFSFETGSDARYFLLVTELSSAKRHDGTYDQELPTGIRILLGEGQVAALSNALSRENLLAKAKEADDVANKKAGEEQRNETLKQSLQ